MSSGDRKSASDGARGLGDHARASERGSEQRLRVLTQATQVFGEGARAPERSLELVVRDLAQTPDSACAVLLLTDDGSEFVSPYSYAPVRARWEAFRAQLPMTGSRRIETQLGLPHVVETLTPRLLSRTALSRVEPDDEGAKAVLGADISSLLLVPLIVGDRVIGAIEMVRFGDSARSLDERDLALAHSLSEHTALALAAVQLLRTSEREIAERKRMAARLSLFAEASHEFAEATGDYDQLLSIVTRRLAEVVGDICSLRAVSEDGQMLERGAVHHADPDIASWVSALTSEPTRLDEGVAGEVARSGQPIFIPRLTPGDWSKALPQYRQILERLKIGSCISVPLRCRGNVVGVASLARSGTENPYTEDDLNLVQSVADRAALAIGNARSYRAERAARAAALKANEALRQSEVSHRLLFESSPVPVVAFSIDSLDILAVNRAGLRLYGYTHDEMLAMKLSDLRFDADEATVRANLASGGDGDVTGLARHRRKDGKLLFVEYHSHQLSFLGHRARLAVMLDITARHEAEQMRSLLSAIVHSSNDAIISEDLNGVITSWNSAAERLFGYSSAEAVGRSIALVIPSELQVEEAQFIDSIRAGDTVLNYETVRRCKNGRCVPVSLSLSPIFDPAGKVIGASKTARDLSARLEAAEALRKTEEQLRHAQKMEAIGRLAGGIAHDFNNALSVILGCSGLVLRDLKVDDPARADIDEIQAAAVRAADLTRQLLTFSRQQVVAPRVLDLNRVILEMDKILRRILGEDIDLVSLPAKDLGRVLADPSHLDQVVMNLVVNARDAMPQGGKLTIETANVELDAEYVREHLGAKSGPHVMLAVSDTGHGMDSATQSRIFEPFFTTKQAGKGTGLGLSTVFGIAQQVGGSVWVYSELGQGTTFKVYFPRVEMELEDPLRLRTQDMRSGTETVLLVEDQDNVRTVAHSILRRAGYQVVVARAADDALLLCEHHRGPIDLLLTDVVMPRLSGSELAARVTSIRPETKVLYMSGYTDDSIVRHGVLESEMAFVQKPFTPELLTAKVRDVLDGHSPARSKPTRGDIR